MGANCPRIELIKSDIGQFPSRNDWLPPANRLQTEGPIKGPSTHP